MKKNINIGLIVASVLLTILAGLAWINNITVARQWDPEKGFEATPKGWFSWLDRTAVDYSTAATFIPFFGMLFVTAGLFRISASGREPSQYFPFFRPYNSITVAMGLIGTVWGLIMIGYYDPNTIQMSDLILCMQTALYSTLVALVWVFILGYPLGGIMRWWERQVSERTVGEDTDIGELFEGLGESTNKAKDGLTKTGTEAETLKGKMEDVKIEFGQVEEVLKEFKKQTGVDVSGALKEACYELVTTNNQVQEVIDGIKQEAESRFKLAEEQRAALSSTTRELEAEREMRKHLEVISHAADKKQLEAELTAEKAIDERKAAEQRTRAVQKKNRDVSKRLKRIGKLLPPQLIDDEGEKQDDS